MIPVRLPSGKEVMLSPIGAAQDYSQDSSPYKDVSFRVSFQDIVDVTTEIGSMLRNAVERIAPSKATVELGVGIDAKTGQIVAFFVDGGMNGSLRIVLEWSKPPKDHHDS